MSKKKKKNKKIILTPEELINMENNSNKEYYISVALENLTPSDNKQEFEKKIWFLIEVIKSQNNDYIIVHKAIKKLEELAIDANKAKYIIDKINATDDKYFQKDYKKRKEYLIDFLELKSQNKCKCEKPYLYGYPEYETFLTVLKEKTLIKTDKKGVEYYQTQLKCPVCGTEWIAEELRDYEIRQIKWIKIQTKE